jgi:hypothetical protein
MIDWRARLYLLIRMPENDALPLSCNSNPARALP